MRKWPVHVVAGEESRACVQKARQDDEESDYRDNTPKEEEEKEES